MPRLRPTQPHDHAKTVSGAANVAPAQPKRTTPARLPAAGSQLAPGQPRQISPHDSEHRRPPWSPPRLTKRRGILKPPAKPRPKPSLSKSKLAHADAQAAGALARRLVLAKRTEKALTPSRCESTPQPRLAPISSDLLASQPAAPTSRRALTLIHRHNAQMCRLLVDRNGQANETFSIALSDFARDSARTAETLRQYESAFVWFFEPVVAAHPNLFELLLSDVSAARRTVAAALALQGFEIKSSRYADGSFEARPRRTPPARCFDKPRLIRDSADLAKDGGSAAAQNIKRCKIALLVLKGCFDLLIVRGRWLEQNPLKVDRHEQLVRLINSTPAPSWSSPFARYAGNMFNLRGHETEHYASRDTTFYKPTILKLARGFPPGVELVTRVAAEVGARICEPMSLNLIDWVRCGAGREILCPNKGSRGLRSKILILPQALANDLATYIDDDRSRFSQTTMRLVRRLARPGARISPLHAELLAEPLFLSPRGLRITPDHYRGHYFRPALKSAGLGEITPHRLRHEHALRSLLAIRRMSFTPEVEAARIAEYAMLQGWKSGPSMVHYYAPQFRQMTQRALSNALYADELANTAFLPIAEATADPLITRQHRELHQMFGDFPN